MDGKAEGPPRFQGGAGVTALFDERIDIDIHLSRELVYLMELFLCLFVFRLFGCDVDVVCVVFGVLSPTM